MTAQYVVVARSATFGPFPTVTAAKAWADHPNRTADLRPAWVIVPLFGGIALDDQPKFRCPTCGWTGDQGYCPVHHARTGALDDEAEAWTDVVGSGMAERCYQPGCRNWVTGASDYCSDECEARAREAEWVEASSHPSYGRQP